MVSGGGGDIEAEAKKLGIPVKTLQASEQWRDAEIWPDQEQTVAVFSAMMTQWRFGPAGATGLDYTALPAVMDMLDVRGPLRQEVFCGIRIMERAALKGLRDSRRG